jgi:ParB/RepB/Spo0J family partition protein
MQVSELKDGACLRVPLGMLVDAPWGNVRRGKRNERKYGELRDSIAQRGVVQAITVRPNEDENTLEVLAGYGRREASAEVGVDDIPVVIKRVDDKEAMAIGLAENLQREDLSITDEIKVAQQYVSLFDADYEEAAKAIGWPERKIRGRLKLNDCTPDVLEALGKGEIKIGHAEVLCQFVEKLQNNTLNMVIEESWTVDYLKERANKATRFLRHAKFDTTDCQQCQHNSSVQAQLFDNHIGEAKCGNLPCYREKSDAWVMARKAELEEEEGKVFLNVEKPSSDRNEVSEGVVGKDAFAESCLGCVNRVRVLQDGINKDCGTVTDNQCIDISCFKKMVAAKASEEAEKASAQSPAKKVAAKKKDTSKKVARPTISAGMTEQARQFARKVIGGELVESKAYQLAVLLQGVSELTGYTPNGRTLSARSDNIKKLVDLDVDKLREELNKAIQYGTTEASQASGRLDGTSVVLASACHVGDAKERVIKAWSPTKDWLSTYQKGAIEGFCKQRGVGFTKAYDEENGKGAFSKLMKKKKDDIIKAILEFKFDWTEVAPKELVDLVR